VEQGHAHQIDVTYNTNLTVISPALKNLWPNFKSVKILCSIDGFGAVNDLIRRHSRWSVMDRNLRDIDRGFAEYGIREVLISCTVQVYNIFRLHELYDYLASEFENVIRLPNLVDLHFPDHYRTQILPADMKRRAEERLLRLLEVSEARIASGAIPAAHSYLLDHLRGSINFMNMENLERLAPTFHKVAVSKDTLDGISVYHVIPELRPLAYRTAMKSQMGELDGR
jgi:hypothetical protein